MAWHWCSTLFVATLGKDVVEGECSINFSKEYGCWVNPFGDQTWASCDAATSEAACAAYCDTPNDVTSQCAGKEDKDGDWGEKDKDDWGDKDGEDWGNKEGDSGKKGDVVASTQDFVHAWQGADKTRTYSLVEPPSTCTRQGLLIVLQPVGGSCGDLGSLAGTLCVVVGCPFAGAEGWKNFHSAGDSEDVEFIAALIQHLASTHKAPADHVIVTGFSAGGSMAYRVGCERSDVIGGMVAYGQSFLEPAAGHVPKDQESPDMTTTEQALDMGEAARQTADKCDPSTKRPHYALVGLQDEYYGEVAGSYKGKALWEAYSGAVLGCGGEARSDAALGIAEDAASCSTFASCGDLDASLNKYCTVAGMGHVTQGWGTFVRSAFRDFFDVGPIDTANQDKGNGTSQATSTTAMRGGAVAAASALIFAC